MATFIDNLICRANAAQKAIEFWPQEKIDEMDLAIGWENY